MNRSVEALENQYFSLRESLSTLMAQGATSDQLDELRSQIVRSRTNYWTAVNSILHDDDPEVQKLVAELNTAQLSLAATIEHMGNIEKVLNAITQAVDIGSMIVAKAVSL